ncbi:MAG: enoyl-CoA hydratase/isomerase family protein [Rhizobiaceae bacterium]|nr:enoyl-CoA hydratase/isomerase family protein [Rhizobiaceae bacterium]
MSNSDILIVDDSSPGVRCLTLNRPDRLNALDGELTRRLLDTVRKTSADETIKVIVVKATGRAFCAGADLKWLNEGTLADHHAHLAFQDDLADLCNSLEAAPQVAVGAIQGFALAGGLELALACDMLVVSERAEMGDEHIRRNLIAGGGGSQRLPRKIGLARGLYHLLSGARMTGRQAAEYGLACAAVPTDQVEEKALELARSLAKTDAKALAMTKELVRRGLELPLREGLWLERWTQYRYRNASDAMDKGVAQFAEKRA